MVKDFSIIDDYTIQIYTEFPYPLLPNDLGTIYIMSEKNASHLSNEEIEQGKGKIIRYNVIGNRAVVRPTRYREPESLRVHSQAAAQLPTRYLLSMGEQRSGCR